VLSGGYKAFRNWALKANEYTYPLQLLSGYTGSGKTALLKELEAKGEPVLNLEELACHKGSAFGNIGMPPQPSQEMFENLLAMKVQSLLKKANTASPNSIEEVTHKPEKRIWVEDESQRIGHVNIPNGFWQNMRTSPISFVDIPFEERLNNLVAEYGNLDKGRMIAAIERISKRLGPLETKLAIQHLQEGNTRESFQILLHYYDKRYLKGLHNRVNLDTLLTKIPCDTVSVHNAVLVSQTQKVTTYAGAS
jgi:tRNA 2-selenouridine synthase